MAWWLVLTRSIQKVSLLKDFYSRLSHITLPDGPGLVKQPDGQVNFDKVSIYILYSLFWKMQHLESWASTDCYICWALFWTSTFQCNNIHHWCRQRWQVHFYQQPQHEVVKASWGCLWNQTILTHWSLKCSCNLKFVMFKLITKNLEHFLWNCPEVNAPKSHWLLVYIGSSKGLVPPGNKVIAWANVDPDVLSHTPHCFEGTWVRIMFVNRPWAIQVL